ncbi:hypothetical protein ACJX0J_017966, partial [Zea mays]
MERGEVGEEEEGEMIVSSKHIFLNISKNHNNYTKKFINKIFIFGPKEKQHEYALQEEIGDKNKRNTTWSDSFSFMNFLFSLSILMTGAVGLFSFYL